MVSLRQVTIHYLTQCWPRFMSSNSVIIPQWVNGMVRWCDETIKKRKFLIWTMARPIQHANAWMKQQVVWNMHKGRHNHDIINTSLVVVIYSLSMYPWEWSFLSEQMWYLFQIKDVKIWNIVQEVVVPPNKIVWVYLKPNHAKICW